MTKTLSIDGMSCEHCVTHVQSALQGVDGVASADVSLEVGTAHVELAQDVATDALIRAVQEAGYEAEAAD
ncbi:MAG: heavy-metal-associated domain-containing protein [Candidatus Bipolaricaulia bacterium]